MTKHDTSPHDEATELTRQCLEALSDGSYVDRFADLVARDFLWHNTFTGETVEGPGGWIQYSAVWLAGFPDMSAELVASQPLQNGARCRITWTGTFTGTMMTPEGNVQGNGRRLVLESSIEVGTKDGKLTRWVHSQDPADVMRQLGLG